MPLYPHELDDPFAGSTVPSLSWKTATPGTLFQLEILEPAQKLQSSDFETRQPAFWDPETKTRPKMAAVLTVKVLRGPHSVGEERSIWAIIPSSMFAALKEAQEQAEAKFAPGGLLEVRFVREEPHKKNPHFHPIKIYEAHYDPRGHTLEPDPFIPEPPSGASHGYGKDGYIPEPTQAAPQQPQDAIQRDWIVSQAGTRPRPSQPPQEAPRVAGGGFGARRGR